MELNYSNYIEKILSLTGTTKFEATSNQSNNSSEIHLKKTRFKGIQVRCKSGRVI